MAGEYFAAKMEQAERERARVAAQGSAEMAALAPLGPVDSPGMNYVGLPATKYTMAENFARGAKTFLKPLSLTFEGLERATTGFRETLLWAGGVTTTKGYKDRFEAAMRGDHKVSGKEFLEYVVGRDTFDALESSSFPEWLRSAITPEHVAIGTKGGKKPRVSTADVFGFGVDLLVDPFAVLSLTPVGAGRYVPGIVKKATALPFRPVTKFLDTMFAPSKNSLLGFVNFARDPENVMTGPLRTVLEEWRFAGGKAARAVEESMERAQNIGGTTLGMAQYHKEADQRIAAWLHGQELTRDGATWRLTGKRGLPALGDDELKVAEGFRDLANEKIHALVAAKKLDEKYLGTGLREIMPALVGKTHVPEDIFQSWSQENIGRVFMRLRNGDDLTRVTRGGGTRKIQFGLENLSAIDSMKDFIYAAERKLNLEDALLKYAPGKGEANLRPLKPSFWQRRYLTDKINEATGHSRGRKMIMFDIMAAEFAQNALQSPAGRRVNRLMEKMGHGLTPDGFSDFSVSTKLTGMLTHNIIRATLGGRLRSAIQNVSQVLNFGVSRGMPATLKGMYKMSSPEFASLRKMENLRGDYQAFWKADTWISKTGQTFDNVIFAPFNAAEDVIRGTGFNLGLDAYMKKNGFDSIDAIRRAGKLEEATRFAHMESVNGAFIYGWLGRAPVVAGQPALKLASTLLSFPIKQAEFLRRSFMADGSAVMRFIGLHGFLIEQANAHMGVAAEDFLGWGFKPMTRSFGGIPIMTSPPVKVLFDTAEGLQAYANGDNTLAEKKFKDAWNTLPLAIAPVPGFLAVKDVKTLSDRITSKRQEIGDEFVPISTPEAITNFLISRSTTQRLRTDLARRQTRALKKIDWVLDKRAKAVVDSVLDPSQEGDKLAKAMWDFASGIEIEGKLFFPSGEMFEGRMERYMAKRTVSKDLRAMMDNQFLQQVFLAAQLELLTRVQESGGAPVSMPRGRGVAR